MILFQIGIRIVLTKILNKNYFKSSFPGDGILRQENVFFTTLCLSEKHFLALRMTSQDGWQMKGGKEGKKKKKRNFKLRERL